MCPLSLVFNREKDLERFSFHPISPADKTLINAFFDFDVILFGFKDSFSDFSISIQIPGIKNKLLALCVL